MTTQPICERVLAYYYTAHLIGVTRPAAMALSHLAQEWKVADASDSLGLEHAIWEVLCTRSGRENRDAFELILMLTLGDYAGERLLDELASLDELAAEQLAAPKKEDA